MRCAKKAYDVIVMIEIAHFRSMPQVRCAVGLLGREDRELVQWRVLVGGGKEAGGGEGWGGACLC